MSLNECGQLSLQDSQGIVYLSGPGSIIQDLEIKGLENSR